MKKEDLFHAPLDEKQAALSIIAMLRGDGFDCYDEPRDISEVDSEIVAYFREFTLYPTNKAKENNVIVSVAFSENNTFIDTAESGNRKKENMVVRRNRNNDNVFLSVTVADYTAA